MIRLSKIFIVTFSLFFVLPSFAASGAARGLDTQHIERMQSFIGLMQGFYDIIESTHGIAKNSEMSAILEMQKIGEIYKDRGDRAKAIEVFYGVLEKTHNQTIRNAAYHLLGEALKETGRQDEAITVLEKSLSENIKLAK